MTQSPRVHITNNLTVALIQQTLGEQTCLQRPHLTVSINIHKCNTKTRIKSCFSTFITSLHLTNNIDFNSQCLNSLFFSLSLCVLLTTRSCLPLISYTLHKLQHYITSLINKLINLTLNITFTYKLTTSLLLTVCHVDFVHRRQSTLDVE